VAKERFVAGESLERVLDVVAAPDQPKKGSLAGDIEELTQALKRHSWTTLAAARGDAALLERVEEAEKLLKDLRRALG
jgi:ParB family chromosome partitioning protein